MAALGDLLLTSMTSLVFWWNVSLTNALPLPAFSPEAYCDWCFLSQGLSIINAPLWGGESLLLSLVCLVSVQSTQSSLIGCHEGVTSCCLLKWRHFHEAFHSCDTYALIRGSSESPEPHVVYSVENKGFVFVLFSSHSAPPPHPPPFSLCSVTPMLLALYRSLFFFPLAYSHLFVFTPFGLMSVSAPGLVSLYVM